MGGQSQELGRGHDVRPVAHLFRVNIGIGSLGNAGINVKAVVRGRPGVFGVITGPELGCTSTAAQVSNNRNTVGSGCPGNTGNGGRAGVGGERQDYQQDLEHQQDILLSRCPPRIHIVWVALVLLIAVPVVAE